MLPPTLLAAFVLMAPPADDPKKPPVEVYRPDAAWKSLGKDLWLDAKGRRVILRGRVALREGPLEHLLCLTESKEHESVFATEAPARGIHAGLIVAVGEPGHPVRFRPNFEPPAGPKIEIEIEWTEGGVVKTLNAKEFVRDEKTAKPLAIDWVFAGSDLFVDPDTKQTIYAADGGDLITVSNFTGAILDLPFRSSADDGDRVFVANTAKLPPRGTPVTIILKAPRSPVPKP